MLRQADRSAPATSGQAASTDTLPTTAARTRTLGFLTIMASSIMMIA